MIGTIVPVVANDPYCALSAFMLASSVEKEGIGETAGEAEECPCGFSFHQYCALPLG